MDLDELKEDIGEEIKYSETDLDNLRKSCKTMELSIGDVMKKVADGKRLSARNLDKFDTAQLRQLVCDMFSELSYTKELFSHSIISSLEGAVEMLSRLPARILQPLINQSEHSVTINDNFAKVDQFISNEQSSQVQFEKLETICNELKGHISTLEGLKSDLSSQPPPPPVPTIIDWSNIKFPPLPEVTKHDQDTAFIRKEVRLSQDIQLRKNNVILRGLPVSVQTNDPLVTAKSFLANCGIEHYELSEKYLVSAFYLNRRDGHCTIRMIFSDQWTADQILQSAYQLKSGKELYCRVYLDKDRTDDEMKAHRMLVADLRKRREDHPTIRWVIRNGTIMNRGPISKPM